MKKSYTSWYFGIRPVFKFWLLLLFITMLYWSCNKMKDDFDFSKIVKPTWNPEFAMPLVNSTLYISDFFEDSSNLNIVTNPDKSISFIYSADEIVSATAGDFIKFKDQSFDFSNPYVVGPIFPGFFDTTRFVQVYQFIADTSNQRIDSLFLKNGFLQINGSTNLNRDHATLSMVIPDIKNIQTGAPLTIFANLDNPGGQNDWIYFDTLYNLNEYKIVLNTPSDTVANSITFLLEIVVYGDESPDLSPYVFNLNGSLLSLEFSKAFGYIAQYNLKFKNTIDIGLFDKVVNGSVNIGDGSVKLVCDVKNSFGAPITFTANDIFVESPVNEPSHVDIFLFGEGNPNVFDINSPDIQHIGESVETRLDFTQANFHEAFNIAPNVFYFDLSAITNIEADTTTQNFIMDTSTIALDVDLELELFASIADLTVIDTVILNMTENPNELEYLLFRINIANGFPINAAAQVYFTDENYFVLDSLITGENNVVLPGAPVGGPPAYRVTGTSDRITDVLIDRKRLEHIIDAKYLLLKTSISTSGQNMIKIYNDYSLTLKLGIVTGLDITSEN